MIYTAITDNKDHPRKDIPCFHGENLFTSPILKAKIYKVLPHKFLDTEYSIWVDGNVFPKQPEDWYYGFLKHHDIAVLEHPKHNCVYKEAELCKQMKVGNQDKIKEQIDKYKKEAYPENHGLGQCCMLIRRHTPEQNRLNEAWWAEICRHSWRDQISFPYIFRDKANYIPHARKKHWHEEHNDNPLFQRKNHARN